MKYLQSIVSRTGFLIAGLVLAVGTTSVYAAWAPSPKNTYDPLYSSDWNTAAHNASGWERTGDISNPGDDVFLNTNGGVGIGNNSVSADLSLDVEGKAGAEEYCDENGGNCFRAPEVEQAAKGTIPGGGLQMVNSEIGIITVGCNAGQVIKFNGNTWQCSNEDNDLRNGYSCAAGEILRFDGTDWSCAAGDSVGAGAGLSCSVDQIMKFDGTDWTCAADDVGGSSGDTLAGLTCAVNEVVKWNGTDWTCAADDGGGGSGGDTLAGLTCANNEVAKWNNNTSTWFCAADNAGGGGIWSQTGNNAYYNTGKVAIGTASQFDSLLTIVGNGVTNEGDVHHFSYSDNPTFKPDYRFKRARGTESAPVAVQAGDGLGTVTFMGYDGTVFNSAYSIYAITSGVPAPGTELPADLYFYNETDGIGFPQMVLKNDHSIGIGTENVAAGLLLDVEGRVGATEYCNSEGTDCVSAANLAGSAGDTLDSLTCALNEIAKWDGSTWICAADNAAGGGYWNRTGDDIYYNDGRVGIGTVPDAEVDLHIAGDGEITLEDWSTGIYFNDQDDGDFILGTSLNDVEGPPGLAVFRGNYDTDLWQRTMTIGDNGNVTVSGNGEGNIASIGRVTDATALSGAFGMAVSGNYVYVVAARGDRFQVIDVSDPKNPVLLGGLHDPTNLNNPIHVAVKGDYAYVAARDSNNLEVIDISDPANPVSVGRLTDPINLAGIFDLVIYGNRAYITAQESHNLEIIDISNPTNPVSVGRLTDPVNLQTAKGLAFSGGYAFVASQDADNLEIIDVSNPTDPISVGRLTDPVNLDMAWDVAVAGKYAFVSAYGSSNLEVVDVSDPTNPVSVGRLTDMVHLDGATDVDVSGNYAFIMSAYTDNLEIIDISDPTNPVNYGRLTDTVNLSGPRNVSIHNNYAYVTAIDSNNFEVIDIGSVFGGGSLLVDGEAGIGTRNPSDGLRLDVEGRVGATEYCDENGSNCYTTADLAGGGTGGDNWGSQLVESDNTLSGSGTSGNLLSVNYNNVQRRISSNCPAGSSIRSIAQNGTVTCESATGIDGISCTADEILIYNGSNWVCDDGSGIVSGDNWGSQVVQSNNTISGNGTNSSPLSVNASNIQQRVGSSCPTGSSIRSIAQDGSVICEIDDGGNDTLSSVSCLSGQVVKYNGTTWSCANDNTGNDNDWVISGSNMSSGVTGKVGIGTTNPAADAKLEVRGGTIRATDGLIIEVRTNDPSGGGLVDGRMWLRSDI